jgi:general secretion pathway protein K
MRNDRGFALMVTLAVISVIVVTTVTLNRMRRLAATDAAIARDQVTLTQMADSGIQIAMAMLIRDRMDSQTDTIQENWASKEKWAELLADFPFEEGSVDVGISDERGRIQINALVALPGHAFNEAQYHLWDRLLGYLKQSDKRLADLDTAEIINSIKDWIDSGDDDAITGLSGAESSYYESLDPPYPCRNGPMDNVEELFRVKGVTRDLLAGVGANLLDYLTVNGVSPVKGGGVSFDGKINIDTAPLPVIAAILPEEYHSYASDVVDFREDKTDNQYTNALPGLDWYRQVPGLEDLSLSHDLITNSSDLFRITATATLHDRQQRVTAVVEREKGKESGKWGCRILRWWMD